MKHRNSIKSFLTLALLPLVFSSNSVFATVNSISPVSSINNGKDEYQQVSVQCTTRKARLLLRKKAGANEWCDAVLGTFCGGDKVVAARKMCTRKYVVASKKQNPSQSTERPAVAKSSIFKLKKNAKKESKSANVDALMQEKFEIEQKTLEIEARKLELWRRELAIRKEQLALTAN